MSTPYCDAVTLRFAPVRWNSTALPQVAEGERAIFYVCVTLLGVSVVSTVGLKAWGVRSADLDARPLSLTLMTHLAVFFQLCIGSYSHFNSGMLPCPFVVIAAMLVIPLLSLPAAVRLNLFSRRYFLAKKVAGVRATYMSDDEDAGGGETPPPSPLAMAKSARRVVRTAFGVVTGALLARNKDVNAGVRLSRWMTSSYGIAVQFLVLFFPFAMASLLLMLANADYASPCVGCVYTEEASLALMILGAVCIIYLTTVWFLSNRAMKANDPFHVLTEIRIELGLATITLLAYILHTVWGPEYRNGYRDGFSFNYFVGIFITMFALVAGLGVNIMALNNLRRLKRDRDLPPGGADLALGGEGRGTNDEGGLVNKQVARISNNEDDHIPSRLNPRARFANSRQTSGASFRVTYNFATVMEILLNERQPHEEFENYLASEWASESLSFLDAVKEWTTDYFSQPPNTNNLRARKIVKLFVGQNAEFPINISSDQADELCRNVAQGAAKRDESIPITTFDEACAELKKMLAYGPVPRFTRTKQFRSLMERGVINGALVLRPVPAGSPTRGAKGSGVLAVMPVVNEPSVSEEAV